MEWFEPDVEALENARRAHPLPATPATPTVFYGSSSIRLWSTLARDLGNRCVVNLGFGGSTLEACVHFFERLVPPAGPSSLVVYAGDNDLGDGRRPDEVARSFEQLIAKVNRDLKGIPFGFVSIKPSPARIALLEEISETNDAIRRTIARHPLAFYINVFTPMLGPKGQPRRELFLEDGLHLSPIGYQLWARVLRWHRDRIFTKPCPSSHTTVLSSKLDGPGVR